MERVIYKSIENEFNKIIPDDLNKVFKIEQFYPIKQLIFMKKILIMGLPGAGKQL